MAESQAFQAAVQSCARPLNADPSGGIGLELESLSTFAEVGIALAGFSGVVVVLGRRAVGEWTPIDRLRIHILLELSLLIVLFSLLPLVLQPLRLVELTELRLCNGLFALAHALVIGLIVARRRPLMVRAEATSRLDAIRLSVGALIVASQVYASVTASAPTNGFVYLATLTWLLVMGGLEFGLLLLQPLSRNAA